VAGVDYQINTRSDGTGADLTGQVSINFDSVSGTTAALRITNNSGIAAYLLAGTQIRGLPLISSDEQLVEQLDFNSMEVHGPRVLMRRLPLLDSVASAAVMARAELDRRRLPRVTIRAVSVTQRSHADAALTLTLFDSIRVVDAHSGHDGHYRIISETHRLERGGLRHHVTWGLEADDSRLYWALGSSALDVSTRLAY
jgi:hypothetical protein